MSLFHSIADAQEKLETWRVAAAGALRGGLPPESCDGLEPSARSNLYADSHETGGQTQNARFTEPVPIDLA